MNTVGRLQTVIIPWRASENVARLRAYVQVMEHLLAREFYPLPIDAPGAWSPGRARNRGAYLSSNEVLVFNDADTICPARGLRQAIVEARESPGLVYAYDLYLRRDERGFTERELYAPASAGAIAISRASFDELGGFDESFEGWGYEDCDFARRAAALWPVRRVSGPVSHIWHGARRPDDSPGDAEHELVTANLERYSSRLAR